MTPSHMSDQEKQQEPYGFEAGLVQLLNEARCLSPRTIGNRELAGRVMKYIRMNWQAESPQEPLTDEQLKVEWLGFNDPVDNPISLSDFEYVARTIERTLATRWGVKLKES